MQHYNDILAEVLIDEETLQARIQELGAEISADYPDGNLLLICILRGGVPFLVHLSRHISAPHMMDFMAVSSYGVGKRESSGTVRVTFDLQTDIRDKDVLLVEDIIDSGHTIASVLEMLNLRQPRSLKVCALLDKAEPALVVSDLMMPGLDGVGLTGELQRRGLRPGLPLIIVSADADGRRKAAALGAEAYFSKPFDLSSLLDTIARLAPTARSAHQPST